MVQLLFPGQEPSTVSSESVKATMNTIFPIDQWKNLRKFSARTLRIPETDHSLNYFSERLDASVPYLKALFLVEGVNYFSNVYNGTFSLSQMKIWFERIGVKIEIFSQRIASSDSLQKTHISRSTMSPSRSEKLSLHDELANSFGITKQKYSNVVRLLFHGQEISTVSGESVKAKMNSIFPVDQWKFLARFNGSHVSLKRIPHSIVDIAPLLNVEPAYIVSLLLCEGISFHSPSEKLGPEEMKLNLNALGVQVNLLSSLQGETPNLRQSTSSS